MNLLGCFIVQFTSKYLMNKKNRLTWNTICDQLPLFIRKSILPKLSDLDRVSVKISGSQNRHGCLTCVFFFSGRFIESLLCTFNFTICF